MGVLSGECGHRWRQLLGAAVAYGALTLGLPGTLAAQEPSVMVIYQPNVPDRVRVQVGEALSDFRVVDVEGYVEAASAQNLYPLSDDAFARVLPGGGVDVAVVVRRGPRGYRMVLRSGRDGDVLSQRRLRVARGRLARGARAAIPRAVLASADELGVADDLDEDDGLGSDVGQDEEPSEDDAFSDDEALDEDDSLSDDEALGEDDSFGEDDSLGGDQDDDDDGGFERTILLHVDLGAGLGFRELEWPLGAGVGTVSLGPSAALDLGLEMIYDPQGSLSVGIEMRYQSTVGATVDEYQIAGVERSMGIRSARYEALLVPRFDLAEAFKLGFGLGYGLRGLRTHVHDQEPPTEHNLQTPDYTLAGPVARVSAMLVFGDVVTVKLEPEVQLLVSVGSELTNRGAGGGGVSLGGQASVVFRIIDHLSLYLSYREAHAAIGGKEGKADTSDMERFVTAGVRGGL